MQIYHGLKLEQVTDMIFNMLKVEACQWMRCCQLCVSSLFALGVGRITAGTALCISCSVRLFHAFLGVLFHHGSKETHLPPRGGVQPMAARGRAEEGL